MTFESEGQRSLVEVTISIKSLRLFIVGCVKFNEIPFATIATIGDWQKSAFTVDWLDLLRKVASLVLVDSEVEVEAWVVEHDLSLNDFLDKLN